MIVDDEWSLREFLKSKLSELGYEITAVQSGEEFVEAALSNPPDLIMLDLLPADGFGVDYYDKLLQAGFDKRIPVIFISSLAEQDPPRHAPPEGRFALFGKPFDYQELLRETRKLLATPSHY